MVKPQCESTDESGLTCQLEQNHVDWHMADLGSADAGTTAELYWQ